MTYKKKKKKHHKRPATGTTDINRDHWKKNLKLANLNDCQRKSVQNHKPKSQFHRAALKNVKGNCLSDCKNSVSKPKSKSV